MPYTWADVPFFALLPVMLAGSAFFSASETALFGLSAHQRLALTRGKGFVAHAVGYLLADQRTLLITLMLGNMMVNVTYFVVSSALLLKLDPATVHPLWIAAITLVPLLAIILFGEVLPKLIANTVRTGWVRVSALPLYTAHRLLRPIASALSRWLIHPLGRLIVAPRPEGADGELDTDELEALLEMSQRRGVIGSDEQELLSAVLELSGLKVRDVMVPRVDIRAVDVRTPPAKLREMIDRERINQYVVYEGDLDHVLGVIYTRQFLLATRLKRRLATLRALVRNVRFVPELQRVDGLLEDFRKTGTKFAIAVDEYGGTAGLVTLKDVVERMVGEVDMAHVPGEEAVTSATPIGPGTWRVGGRLSIHDWADAFGQRKLPPRVSTVGGLVTALLGRVAQAGDRVRLANVEMEVERVEGRRVGAVILRLLERHEGATPGGGR